MYFRKLVAAFVICLSVNSSGASERLFSQLPQYPGEYTFKFYAKDGFSWDGKGTYITRSRYFGSQQEAWYWAKQVPHVQQISLHSFSEAGDKVARSY